MRSGPDAPTACPFSLMCPSLGRMKPATHLSRLDLPQPDGPSSTKRSAGETLKSTRCVAVTSRSRVLYCSVTPSTESSGAMASTIPGSIWGSFSMERSSIVGPFQTATRRACIATPQHMQQYDKYYIVFVKRDCRATDAYHAGSAIRINVRSRSGQENWSCKDHRPIAHRSQADRLMIV